MVDEERIKELEKLDKHLETRRRLTVAFFVLLSVVLVFYALNIERKIDRLSEGPAVVIYNDNSEEEISNHIGESQIFDDVAADTEDATVNADVKNDGMAESLPADSYEDDKTISDSGQVYYVTASGDKYHKAGCSYLKKSKREITLDEIICGGYDACSRCFKE